MKELQRSLKSDRDMIKQEKEILEKKIDHLQTELSRSGVH